jgi:hypothetical protein
MNDNLTQALRKLRLSGLVQSLEIRLQEARSNNLGHAEFLELIVQDELNIRQQRVLQRRTKAAGFRPAHVGGLRLQLQCLDQAPADL